MTEPKTLTAAECDSLLTRLRSYCPGKKRYHKRIRNYLAALLMLDAGLRVGELVKLRIADLVYYTKPVASIIISPQISKSKRERQIPVSDRLFEAIKEMQLTWWSPDSVPAALYAFYRTDPAKPLTARQVRRTIQAAAMPALGRPVYPHMLRHTFATRLMRKTNARVVQQLLGHRYLTSTQVYCHPNQDDLKQAIDSLGGDKEPAAPK